eukprot:scaffold56926_cov76-Phaeocystis_antarctica.AAC.2
MVYFCERRRHPEYDKARCKEGCENAAEGDGSNIKGRACSEPSACELCLVGLCPALAVKGRRHAGNKECESDCSGIDGDNASRHGPLPREVVWPDAQEVTRGVPLPRQ